MLAAYVTQNSEKNSSVSYHNFGIYRINEHNANVTWVDWCVDLYCRRDKNKTNENKIIYNKEIRFMYKT